MPSCSNSAWSYSKEQVLMESSNYTPQQQAVILSNIASTSNVLGQKQEALKHYEQALQLHKKVQNPFMQGVTLHNMGKIYADQHRYDIALAYVLRAKALCWLLGTSVQKNQEMCQKLYEETTL